MGYDAEDLAGPPTSRLDPRMRLEWTHEKPLVAGCYLFVIRPDPEHVLCDRRPYIRVEVFNVDIRQPHVCMDLRMRYPNDDNPNLEYRINDISMDALWYGPIPDTPRE